MRPSQTSRRNFTGAELKVYLEIMRREIRAGHAIAASSRQLAKACDLGCTARCSLPTCSAPDELNSEKELPTP